MINKIHNAANYATYLNILSTFKFLNVQSEI